MPEKYRLPVEKSATVKYFESLYDSKWTLTGFCRLSMSCGPKLLVTKQNSTDYCKFYISDQRQQIGIIVTDYGHSLSLNSRIHAKFLMFIYVIFHNGQNECYVKIRNSYV